MMFSMAGYISKLVRYICSGCTAYEFLDSVSSTIDQINCSAARSHASTPANRLSRQARNLRQPAAEFAETVSVFLSAAAESSCRTESGIFPTLPRPTASVVPTRPASPRVLLLAHPVPQHLQWLTTYLRLLQLGLALDRRPKLAVSTTRRPSAHAELSAHVAPPRLEWPLCPDCLESLRLQAGAAEAS